MEKRKYIAGLFILALLAWLGAPFWGGRREPSLPISEEAMHFNGAQALKTTRDYIRAYPVRMLGSIEARQSTGFLRDNFERSGYAVSYSHFDATIAGKRQVGRNVLGFKAGEDPSIVAAVAHYDTAEPSSKGALADGSGVGVLLQLAQAFSENPLRHSVLFIASDGAEWGMLGAIDIAQNYPDREKIVAVLSLDGLSAGRIAAFRLDTLGLWQGYTPPWLREISRLSAMAGGLPVIQHAGLSECLQRALPLPRHDQGPFLTAGIPAVGLGAESAIHSSPDDGIGDVETTSFENYGRTAERILRSVDGLSAVPRESTGSVWWSGSTFIIPPAMILLQYLSFAPLAAMVLFLWRNRRGGPDIAAVQGEALGLFAWFLPCVAVYYSIALARRIGLIPLYSLYPPAPEDPVLQSPAWGLLGALLAVGVVLAVGLQLLYRYRLRRRPRVPFADSKAVLLAVLVVVVLLALQFNPYWAVCFLSFPALVWSLVGKGSALRTRALNAIWILASGIVFYFVMARSALELDLGWNLLWYDVLAVSTGTLAWQGYFLAAAAVAVGIRLFTLQLNTGE